MATYVHKINRIVGRNRIEVLVGDVAVLSELAIVPAGTQDPLAGLEGVCAVTDFARDFRNGMNFGIPGLDLASQDTLRPFHQMRVDIDETRQDGPLLQVQDVRACACATSKFLVTAHSQYFSITQRHGGDGLLGRLHRYDLTVAHD